MKERIIFLKERLGFIIDHIDLFLENYNHLTTSYFVPKGTEINQFDFHLISSSNPIIWEKFKIDSRSFQIMSNESLNLSGLVKGKEYIVPPFIERNRLDNFFEKLSNYQYLLEVYSSGDEKLEKIVGELNSNQINLIFKITEEEILLSLEELCKIIINFRDYKLIDELTKQGIFKSKIDLEINIIELMIKEYLNSRLKV